QTDGSRAQLSWSPDGQMIFISGFGYDAATGQNAIATQCGVGNADSAGTASRDGTRIVFATFHEGGAGLCVEDITTGTIVMTVGLSKALLSVALSPNGDKVVGS